MATIPHVPPTLEVPAAPDDMEISSDAGRIDNDIDLDIDLTGDHTGDLDDDFMIDYSVSAQDQDVNQENIMFDDQDDIIGSGAVFDEHLTDASFDEPAETTTNKINEDHAGPLQLDEQIDWIDENDAASSGMLPESAQPDKKPPNDITQEQPVQSTNEPNITDGVHVRDFTKNEQRLNEIDTAQHSEDVLYDDDGPDDPNGSALPTHNASRPTGKSDSVTAGEADASAVSIRPTPNSKETESKKENLNHSVAAETLQEELVDPEVEDFKNEQAYEEDVDAPSDSPSASPYHPVIVLYNGKEISLFPPSVEDHTQTYFLQDSSLALQSIGYLLKACRDVLGNTLGDERELQLEIRDLDLTIGEESAHAFSTSFSELLEIYLSLHSLDNVHEPDPLYVNLTTKTRFSARLSSLRGAIDDGRGMSQLWYSNETEEEYFEEQEDVERRYEADIGKAAEEEYFEEQEAVEGHHEADIGNVEEGEYFEEQEDVEGHHEVETSKPAQQAGIEDKHVKMSNDEPASADQDEISFQFDEENTSDSLTAEEHLTTNVSNEHLGEPQGDKRDQAVVPHNDTKDATVEQPGLAGDNPPEEDEAPQHASDQAGYDEIDWSNSAEGYEDGQASLDLPDQGDEDERASSGSSTVVGDGSAEQQNGKILEAPAAERGVERIAEAESSTANREAGNDENYVNLDYENNEEGHIEVQDTFSAEFEGNFDLEEVGQDDDHFNNEEQNLTATGVQHEQDTDHQAITDSATAPEQHQADNEEETWDDFLEPGQPQESNWNPSEPSIHDQPDFGASTETLVAQFESNEGEQQHANPATSDFFDEITYDDEEEYEDQTNGNEVPANSGQPSESPPGKRSFTEHLEGDPEAESDPTPKRLRSTPS